MEEVEPALQTGAQISMSRRCFGAARTTASVSDKRYLRAGSQSDQEVQREEAGHEHLPVPANHRILVAQGRDDCLGTAEL
jgi:hypothetical protein